MPVSKEGWVRLAWWQRLAPTLPPMDLKRDTARSCYNFLPGILLKSAPERPLIPLPKGGPVTSLLARRNPSIAELVAGLDEGRRKAFQGVVRLAGDLGVSVFLVGGSVRDAMLGTPVLDLDFSVEGDATALARHLARRTGAKATIHPRFGTATVETAQCRVDLVTARREIYSLPGQLPDITPSTILDDLHRRDFSINAMAIRVAGGDKELLDPTGGRQDLFAGVIRLLQDRSFVDDPTRMFRAVRYEQRFGFRIDDATLVLMQEAVSAGHMNAVSGDRWRHEIERILDEPIPGPMLLRASELGLLAGLHPALCNDAGLRALTRHPEGAAEPDEWLAALFWPLAADEGEAVIDRLRLSGRRAAVARDTIELGRIAPQLGSEVQRPSCLFRRLSVFDPLAVALQAKLWPDAAVGAALRKFRGELRSVQLGVTGRDLLEMGAVQGPMVGRVLAELREARLDGAVESGESEKALARALVAQSLEGTTEGK